MELVKLLHADPDEMDQDDVFAGKLQTEFESLVRNIMIEALPSEEDQGEIHDSVVDYVTNHPTVVHSPTKKIRLSQGQEPPEGNIDEVEDSVGTSLFRGTSSNLAAAK